MIYKTAEEFLKNMKSRKARGISYYTITQVADGLGIDWKIVRQTILNKNLENKLGFVFVETSFNQGRYFPAEAIPKLYRFRGELFNEEE